jgi:hypothetical protein
MRRLAKIPITLATALVVALAAPASVVAVPSSFSPPPPTSPPPTSSPSPSATPSGTLDQHQDDASGESANWGEYFRLAQTFTAGMTGTLNTASVNVANEPIGPTVAQPAAAGDVSVEIWATSGGLPSGSAPLAAVTLPAGQSGWVDILFSAPASVAAGTQYAIVLDPDAGPIALEWFGNCGSDSYSGGQALAYDGTQPSPAWVPVRDWLGSHCEYDFAFRTYGTVNATPPPSSTAPGLAGDGPDAVLPLLFATLAMAAALVAVRRVVIARR